MFAWLESASIACARLIRGTASSAKLITPARASAATPSPLVSGWRNPISTAPLRRQAISSWLGGATLSTTSQPRASAALATRRAPACSNCSSPISAPAPAPRSTSTSCESPASLRTTSGTSATRRSPGAVSFGTPIFIGRRSLAVGESARAGAGEAQSKRPRPPAERTLGRAVTVNLTRIYTRLGDSGETHLGDMSRVPKTHPRIEAYGTVDELNANLGLALACAPLPAEYRPWLERIQNDLFDVGADIAAPFDAQRERLRVIPEQTRWLEERCDEVNATLRPLKSFVLPGGTPAAAHLHVCRTVCRRAERLAVACGSELNPEVVRYLNRLSDLLFILSRGANRDRGEVLWEPGRYR